MRFQLSTAQAVAYNMQKRLPPSRPTLRRLPVHRYLSEREGHRPFFEKAGTCFAMFERFFQSRKCPPPAADFFTHSPAAAGKRHKKYAPAGSCFDSVCIEKQIQPWP